VRDNQDYASSFLEHLEDINRRQQRQDVPRAPPQTNGQSLLLLGADLSLRSRGLRSGVVRDGTGCG
jgi:hypothetical protein